MLQMMHSYKWQLYIVDKRCKRKLEERTVMVFAFYHQPFMLGMQAVYGIRMVCKKVDKFFRRAAKKQQDSQPGREDNMEYPLYQACY
jgi:hypothetical protein